MSPLQFFGHYCNSTDRLPFSSKIETRKVQNNVCSDKHSFICNNRSGRCLLGNAWDVIHLIFVLSVSNPWPGNSWSLTFILLIFVKVNIRKVYPVSNISSDIITRWPKTNSFEEWQCYICILRKIKSVLCLAFVSENLIESKNRTKIFLLFGECTNVSFIPRPGEILLQDSGQRSHYMCNTTLIKFILNWMKTLITLKLVRWF